MDSLAKGWFSELSTLWPGQAFSLQVDQVIESTKSDFQEVEVFSSKSWGKVLALDGAIQVTEKDEFSYQEMIAHIPLCSHPNPEKVLVIGGGDGGVVREILRHPTVLEVHLCEIDKVVVEMARKHFPRLSSGLDDSRARVFIDDGLKFVANASNTYDVIIVDSSDPVGPAAGLFQEPFYRSLKAALRPGGIACTQAENFWLHAHITSEVIRINRQIFPSVEYAWVNTPTYPCGQIGFLLLSLAGSTAVPLRKVEGDLSYYDADIHRASFALPRFARKALFQS
mmetsp:Transcript_13680/g.23461  ORF Transcript_13680/g.23461 Transcript_13680/m.23461 type:complete len:282 (+) Transcript_13680:73-918(+)